MAFKKIDFDKPINTSVQVSDMAYVSDILSGGITSTPIAIGPIIEVGSHYIIIDKDTGVSPIITSDQYISFAKRIEANETSMKGYYADITFENTSSTKIEMFAVSSDISLSSK